MPTECFGQAGQVAHQRRHHLLAVGDELGELPNAVEHRSQSAAVTGQKRRDVLCEDVDVLRAQGGKRGLEPVEQGGDVERRLLLAFLDRPEIAGGEALAGLLRSGNAGSNTASDHIIVLAQALAALPAPWRPDSSRGGDPDRPQVLVRCDTAGATHRFADACREQGVGFSFGYPVDARVQDAADTLNLAEGWYPAIDTDGGIRDGAWVAEATTLVNLNSWPPGTRLILRKERPHPGAQLRFTDTDGMRVTAFITDTPTGVVAGQVAGLELRHRQHARVEDRIRELKNTGLHNLPCHGFWANAAWLEIVLAATDLVTWARLIGFTSDPTLARAEIATFRYRVLHVAARITRGARQLRLRIDATWRWASAIATAWQHLRTAFG